jgi:DNA repair photolyase
MSVDRRNKLPTDPVSAEAGLATRAGEQPACIRQTSLHRHESGGETVRETVCKTILNRSGPTDYSLNCYTGCAHACAYCYARYMQRFHPHPEPWGKFVDVKVNAVEVLKRQLRRAKPGEVFVSSACDGWQPIEAQWRLTRRCCEILLEREFQVNVLTKSALVLRDLDVFAGSTARIGVTITTLDGRLQALWEPAAGTIGERFHVLREARRANLATTIMFGPLLPYLSDDAASLGEMFARAAEMKVDRIWVDGLNARPRVWPAVAGLLRRHFPTLHEPYRRLLFDARAKETYCAELGHRVRAAAASVGMADRIVACF